MDTIKPNGKLHPAWWGFMITVILYTAIVSGFAFTNNTKTNRNEQAIKEIRKEQKELQEKIYFELTQIRREIRKS